MSKRQRKRTKTKRRKRPEMPIFEIFKETGVLPKTHFQRLHTALANKKYAFVCDNILNVLAYFQKNNFTGINAAARDRINNIVSAIFTAIADPDFVIPLPKIPIFVGHGHLMTNLVALSDYETTENVLRHVIPQPDNIAKILFLYSVKNKIQLDSKAFFDWHPRVASLWYLTYPLPTIGCVLPHYQANMRRHFEEIDERFSPADHRASLLYFYCTYFAGEARTDRGVKEQINKACQEKLAPVQKSITCKPARDSIAIVTSKWWPNTAVFKSCFPLIDRFRDRYRMTLIHTGQSEVSDMANEYFDKVEVVKFRRREGGAYELTTKNIMENDFQLAYFTDIGMTDESVWLSNLRLAPIQITGHGHPVSTFGSKIDYFVMGEETDKLEDLAKNYSEIPIVLPGLGCAPVWPMYKRQNLTRDKEHVLANCVWGPDKYNYTAIRMLQEIAARTKIHYNIFASRGVHRYNAFLPFEAEIKSLLPNVATVQSEKEYMAYMEESEYGDFAINSWPFGGYNTVVEALYLGKPVVTLEGDRFYNMAASALLRRVGLDNLIATTAPEFIDLCVRMANDPDYLAEQKEKLAAVDLGEALFDTDEPKYFEAAMEYVIDNHERLKKENKPIFTRELVKV